jgi:hypothetical protein
MCSVALRPVSSWRRITFTVVLSPVLVVALRIKVTTVSHVSNNIP